jgi:hypothetical protein
MSDEIMLDNISHFIQTGFLAMVTVLVQIREGHKGEPGRDDVEKAATFLRHVSANLSPSGF